MAGVQGFSPAALRRIRESRGFNRARLAADIDAGYDTIVRYEQGRLRPSPERLEALAAALDVKPGQLLGEQPPHPLDAVVDKLVAEAPALTSEQLDKLQRVFAGV